MKIYQPPKPDFENYPAGQHQMVCVDVIDTGWQMREYNGQQKGMAPSVRLVFQGAEAGSNGERLTVRTFEEFMLWSENSNWYKTMKGWRGEPFVVQVVATQEFNPLDLLTLNTLVTIGHKAGKKNPSEVYANVESIAAWPEKFGAPIANVGYERMCDRDNWRVPQYSSFEDFTEFFAAQEYVSTPTPAQPQQAAPAPQQPASPQQGPTTIQQLIAHWQSISGTVVTGAQILKILKLMEFKKIAPTTSDIPQCKEMLDGYFAAYLVAPELDSPKPGQTTNSVDVRVPASQVAADQNEDSDPFSDE